MKKIFLLLMALCLLTMPVMAFDIPFTNGILSSPDTMDTVAHWSMLKGDFGAGAGFAFLAITNTAIIDLTACGFQTRQTIGIDALASLSKLSNGPVSLLWSELAGVDFGLYAGWCYQANIQDSYSDLKWLGFDWGISIVKRF